MTAVVAAIAVTLLAVTLAGRWAYRNLVAVTVTGSSMEPTFRAGDRVLVRRLPVTKVQRGQVVIVAAGRPVGPPPPDHPLWMIKRLLAVPGDPVPRSTVPALATVPEDVVPDARMVVLSDNPDGSDSRQIGYFYGENLLGVVVRRLPV